MKNYKGLSPDQKNYYVYLAFFVGMAGELYLKVGKTGNLKTRFVDLRKANPTTLLQAYVIDVGSDSSVADGMEYIFKRRLSPLNIHGEWFVGSYQTIDFLEYAFHLINKAQSYDEEVWSDDGFAEFFSKMGHRSEKGYSYEYDWDEILRHNNNYQLKPIDIDEDDEIDFCLEEDFSDLERFVRDFLEKSPFVYPEEKYVDIEPDFDFRDYFKCDECGKERADWWNYKLPYRDEILDRDEDEPAEDDPEGSFDFI